MPVLHRIPDERLAAGMEEFVRRTGDRVRAGFPDEADMDAQAWRTLADGFMQRFPATVTIWVEEAVAELDERIKALPGLHLISRALDEMEADETERAVMPMLAPYVSSMRDAARAAAVAACMDAGLVDAQGEAIGPDVDTSRWDGHGPSMG